MKKVKWCWIAKLYRKGFKLGLCIDNDKPSWIRNIYFSHVREVRKVAKGSIVWVDMKG